jgi:hypothetical protein
MIGIEKEISHTGGERQGECWAPAAGKRRRAVDPEAGGAS